MAKMPDMKMSVQFVFEGIGLWPTVVSMALCFSAAILAAVADADAAALCSGVAGGILAFDARHDARRFLREKIAEFNRLKGD